IGLRRDATRAPIQVPEWQGAGWQSRPQYSTPRPRRTLAYCGQKMVLTMGSTLVQALEGALEFGRQFRFAGQRLGPATLLGEMLPDAIPEVAVGGLLARHRIVRDWNARHFDDAGLDGVDEGKVGHNPGEQSSF